LTWQVRRLYSGNDALDSNSWAYLGGTAAGIASSFLLGFGAGNAIAQGTRFGIFAGRAAQAYTTVSYGWAIGNSAVNFYQGDATVFDGLAFVPAAGFLSNKVSSLAARAKATVRTTPAPNKAARQLRLPKTDATLSGTNTLGYTTANGEVFLQPGMSRALQAHTLRHEGVHSFLSVADNATLAGLRQNAGVGAYSNSAFFNAAEEILAEGIASGSVRQGWRHAFNGEYVVRQGTRFQQPVTRTAFFTELGVGATGLGLFGYGAYELGNYWFGSGE
jgi:hypothetical protein